MPKKMTKQAFNLNMIMRGFSIEIIHESKTSYTNEEKQILFVTENVKANVLEISNHKYLNGGLFKFPNYDSIINELSSILKKFKDGTTVGKIAIDLASHDDQMDVARSYIAAFAVNPKMTHSNSIIGPITA